MRLVIDADSLVYQSSFVAERAFYAAVRKLTPAGGPHYELLTAEADYATAKKLQDAGGTVVLYKTTEVLDFAIAREALESHLRAIRKEVQDRFGPHELVLLLTGSSNFRDRIAALARYKFNRVEKAKPKHYGLCRKFLVDELGAQIVHWYEADDEASILLTEGKQDVAVSSIDKDLLQVPGQHHIPGKGFLHVSEKSGLLRFYIQALSGDSTDGVPGCKGVGAVGAKNIVLKAADGAKTFKELERKVWAAVVGAYARSIEKLGAEATWYTDGEAAALETARLVYLLRERPRNFNWIDLWEPPT